MELKQFARADERFVREYEYGDATVVAVDFGVEGTVDLTGDTLIVVLEDGQQFELELPVDGTNATAFMNNGVLTVEVRA